MPRQPLPILFPVATHKMLNHSQVIPFDFAETPFHHIFGPSDTSSWPLCGTGADYANAHIVSTDYLGTGNHKPTDWHPE
jgi:hypothetical protein